MKSKSTTTHMRTFCELVVPLLAILLFFIVQSTLLYSELALTLLVILLGILMFAVWWNKGEIALFVAGLVAGGVIEILLSLLLGAQQIWLDASFFGIPYWLLLAWGFGFVVIVRVGAYIRHLRMIRAQKK